MQDTLENIQWPEAAYLGQLITEAECQRRIDAAVLAERDACAAVAEGVTTIQHVAHSIRVGVFPEQTDMRDVIAAAIRARGQK